MKKMWLGVVLGAFLMLVGNPAFAVPFLQLDTSDGVYDTGTETIFSQGDVFDLYALVDPDSSFFQGGDTYYISAALVTDESEPVDTGGDYGSFTFAGTTVDVTDDMVYGTAPIDDLAKNLDLPGHGIFPTYFTEFAFELDPAKMTEEYNSMDTPGGLNPGSYADFLYYMDFAVDVSGLDDGYEIHFDLYTKNADGSVNKFAPFSHDAQSNGGPPPPPNVIPEPTTILLIGVGLFCLAGLRKKNKK